MGKGVSLNKKSYRYVLSVMDAFSWFVWLRAVREKSSEVISDEIENIYLEYGPPCVIQSDQGGEFKGAVKRLCHRMNIKLIYSRPFHPQSQGKVERSHRSVISKTEYDFLKMGRKGVYRAENLSNYQRILNEDPKEVLGYKTPFEVCFARSNSFDRTSTPGMEKELLKNKRKCNPSYADRKRQQKHISVVRKDAHTVTARCDRRMKPAYARTSPPSKYSIGEKVYERLRDKGRLQKKCCVTEAVIEKRNLKRHLYKVSYTSLESGRNEKKRLAVDDITSFPSYHRLSWLPR